jgi:hypothetical protein
MGVLTEFVKKEAEQLKAEAHRREQMHIEWIAALERLYDLLEVWLREADGGLGVLKISRAIQQQIREPGLGRYYFQPLVVSLGGPFIDRTVMIVPRARNVAAKIKPPGQELRQADGMVEIKEGSVADYYLFRLVDGDADRWFIQSVAKWNADPDYGNVEELTRDRFEAAILRILK